jgi:hypothetical protein
MKNPPGKGIGVGTLSAEELDKAIEEDERAESNSELP